MTDSCDLKDRKCVPCQGGTPPLAEDKSSELLSQLDEGWKLIENHHIERTYKFPNFANALAFTDRVGAVAEEEGHHPVIELTWGRVKITLYTHKIDGLTESDFVLAAKADAVL
jgi:4a-hydroxytetrahydrobiopterin dehydratase